MKFLRIVTMGLLIAYPMVGMAADSTAVDTARTRKVTVRRDTFIDLDGDGVNDLRSKRQDKLFVKLITKHKVKTKKKKKQ